MFKRLLDRLAGKPAASATWTAGDLVSVVDESSFAVAKVLAVDAGGVHVRLYAQRFSTRPVAEQLGELSTAAPGGRTPFSIGHMPIGYSGFAEWQPERIRNEPVEEEELEGYLLWKEAGGGYF